MNETMVEDGENVVTLFYREASINPNESMLNGFHNQVEFKLFNKEEQWESLAD